MKVLRVDQRALCPGVFALPSSLFVSGSRYMLLAFCHIPGQCVNGVGTEAGCMHAMYNSAVITGYAELLRWDQACRRARMLSFLIDIQVVGDVTLNGNKQDTLKLLLTGMRRAPFPWFNSDRTVFFPLLNQNMYIAHVACQMRQRIVRALGSCPGSDVGSHWVAGPSSNRWSTP